MTDERDDVEALIARLRQPSTWRDAYDDAPRAAAAIATLAAANARLKAAAAAALDAAEAAEGIMERALKGDRQSPMAASWARARRKLAALDALAVEVARTPAPPPDLSAMLATPFGEPAP